MSTKYHMHFCTGHDGRYRCNLPAPCSLHSPHLCLDCYIRRSKLMNGIQP
jgi:hypothetical protein